MRTRRFGLWLGTGAILGASGAVGLTYLPFWTAFAIVVGGVLGVILTAVAFSVSND